MDIADLSLAEKRELARALHRNAGKKISRGRSKGVELGGTRFDPRKDIKRVGTLRSRDLDAYIRKLVAFNSRKTQFVGDREHRPIPKKVWVEYKQLEKKRNLVVAERNKLADNIFIPESGMTAKMRHELMDPTKSQSGNPSVNVDYRMLDRKPSQIRNEKSIKILSKTLKKSLSPSNTIKKIKEGRETLHKMAQIMGAEKLQVEVDKLSNKQFWFLWNHTKFANDLTTPYEVYKQTTRKESATENEITGNQLNKALRQVKWAQKLVLDSGF